MNSRSKIDALIKNIEQLPIGDYSTPLAFSKIIFDTTILESIEKMYQQLDGSTVTDVILVGIGGSHFGVQAVYDALCANQYEKPKITFHVLTSIDTFTLDSFVDWYTALLKNNERRAVTFVVSKTGTTFETASHASLCFQLLKEAQPEQYRKNLCVITDHGSPLWQACEQQEIAVLSIPQKIGGRFSVFSAVGLALLRFLQIDIHDFCAGAQSVNLHDPIATAESLYAAFQKGFLVYDTFIFMSHYAGLGGWVRQLIGESLGKEGKGFLPTLSLGSQDLHSVVQHYFGGKQITITNFVIPQEYPSDITVPDTIFSQAGVLPARLKFARIQKAIIQGMQASYAHAEKPYFTFTLRNNSAFDIGKFMQFKMLEIVYLGELMDINPFDQPQVELYKNETRRLLS